jgi:hypothetical protein
VIFVFFAQRELMIECGKLCKDYVLTGGMPEAVSVRATDGLKESLAIKRQLLTAFELEFN